MDLKVRCCKIDECSHKTTQELEAQTRKMKEKMEVLQMKNETLKYKTSGSEENEHVKTKECNFVEVDENKVGRKKYVQ